MWSWWDSYNEHEEDSNNDDEIEPQLIPVATQLQPIVAPV